MLKILIYRSKVRIVKYERVGVFLGQVEKTKDILV